MKIRIEFTTEEKYDIFNAVREIEDDAKIEIRDESVILEGRFGNCQYDKNNNFIEYNLQPSFIKGMCKLSGKIASVIKGAVGMIKGMIGMLEGLGPMVDMFTEAWFGDTKTFNPDKDDSKKNEDFVKDFMNETSDDSEPKNDESPVE